MSSAYGTYVCNTDGIAERETGYLQNVVDRGADGIVLASVDAASAAAITPPTSALPSCASAAASTIRESTS